MQPILLQPDPDQRPANFQRKTRGALGTSAEGLRDIRGQTAPGHLRRRARAVVQQSRGHLQAAAHDRLRRQHARVRLRQLLHRGPGQRRGEAAQRRGGASGSPHRRLQVRGQLSPLHGEHSHGQDGVRCLGGTPPAGGGVEGDNHVPGA